MTGPEGNSEFCFPRISNVSRNEVEGNKITVPHIFRIVAGSWHLAGNSFIVRCHVTMN